MMFGLITLVTKLYVANNFDFVLSSDGFLFSCYSIQLSIYAMFDKKIRVWTEVPESNFKSQLSVHQYKIETSFSDESNFGCEL